MNSKRVQLSEISLEMRKLVSTHYEEQHVAEVKLNRQTWNSMHDSGIFRDSNDALPLISNYVEWVIELV